MSASDRDDPPSLLAPEAATMQYMKRHNIPLLTESLLMATVPVGHPYPCEAVSQAVLLNPPSQGVRVHGREVGTVEAVDHEVDEILTWMEGAATAPDAVIRLGGLTQSGQDDPVGVSNRNYWLTQLSTLQFDVFQFNQSCGPELPAFVLWMFEDMGCGCVASSSLPSQSLTERQQRTRVFLRWVLTVRANYHETNPFHNFRHAFNVLQTLFVFLKTTTELRRPPPATATCDGRETTSSSMWSPSSLVFNETERFALLFAALCHDLQHVGVNNQFLCDTLHPLALRYGDSAVLERHHACVAFATLEYRPLPHVRTAPAHLRVPSVVTPSAVFSDIAAWLPRRWGFIGSQPQSGGGIGGGGLGGSAAAPVDPTADFPTFRKLVLQCIMGTEVAAHGNVINDVKNRIVAPVAASSAALTDARPTTPVCCALGELLSNDPSARQTLMVALVEAADISNEIRTFDFSKRWAPLVVEEFCQQGDVMASLQWTKEVPPMFRRGVAHPAKDQPGFINFLCLPLYRTLAECMPSVFATCVSNLESNSERWSSGRW